MLKEEHGESRKHRVAHRISELVGVARVWQLLKGLPKQGDECFKSKMNRFSHGKRMPAARATCQLDINHLDFAISFFANHLFVTLLSRQGIAVTAPERQHSICSV
jgi:hypothetical protein